MAPEPAAGHARKIAASCKERRTGDAGAALRWSRGREL